MKTSKETGRTDNRCSDNSCSLYISNQPENTGGDCLFLIDPQFDFVDGSLAVPGAKEDCARIKAFIEDNILNLKDIYVTLDTHLGFHIAHPQFWEDEKGNHPAYFTQITHEDVQKGKYKVTDKTQKLWATQYTKALENPRLPGLQPFTLTIWPPHCLLSTKGNNVDEGISQALRKWEIQHNSMVHYIIKGNNSRTEHYSAFRAEVIVPEDPDTNFNHILYQNLMGHGKIYVAGEAKSHCVNFSVRDLVQKMKEDGKFKENSKIILLEDGMSSVAGFESAGDKFIKDMKTVGVQVQNIEAPKKKFVGRSVI